jgi:hypothetical protein
MPLHDADWIFAMGWIIFLQTYIENLMNRLICHAATLAILLAGGFVTGARGQYLDLIGVTALRAVTTNLNGTGIRVAQVEGNNGDNGSTNAWEVNPTNVAQPVALFTYTSGLGTSTSYPNSVGTWSSHADAVGNNFYGLPGGVATNVAHVDNYDADYFYNNIIAAAFPPNIGDSVVNQSFTFGLQTVTVQQQLDSQYDNYTVQNKTLFVSAVDNGGNVHAPGTSYNCIGVAAYGGTSSIGPTIDNGRCKPDITAPSFATSFSTPQVSGAAAVLMQAAVRGDGGSDTNAAFDMRTVKALLLNGAVKPADWTNSNSSPLDARYGAGVVNVFNSYEQMAGGKHGYVVSTTVSSGGAHPPTGASGTVGVLNGWDFNTNTSVAHPSPLDAVSHYYFNVSNSVASAPLTATATLVWNRQSGQTAINNLNLFLYDCANSNLVACSTSLVDNVEHIYTTNLAKGRYDLQVWKAGGSTVTTSEAYALAWEFAAPPTLLISGAANPRLTWPVYPAGFLVEARTNLLAGAWSTNSLPAAAITNGLNSISLNPAKVTQFFRLRQPNL